MSLADWLLIVANPFTWGLVGFICAWAMAAGEFPWTSLARHRNRRARLASPPPVSMSNQPHTPDPIFDTLQHLDQILRDYLNAANTHFWGSLAWFWSIMVAIWLLHQWFK